MMRLILVVAFIALIAVAAVAVVSTAQAALRIAVGKDEESMPDTFKRIAFGALVILLIGLSTGWLGGL